MLINYLKIALRNISRHKSFTILNTFGLAFGMSVSLLLISFYSDINSFDDFHTRKENIYRIISNLERGLDRNDYASAPVALAKKLYDYPGIQEIVCLNSSLSGEIVTTHMNLPIRGYFADANFFTVFDFAMIQGNPLTALAKPNNIVLTESLAKKIEPSGDLLGSVIEIEGQGNFEVTGIIKDQRHSHFMFEVLISFQTLPAAQKGEENNPNQWTSFQDQYIYLLVANSSKAEGVQQALNRIAKDLVSQSNDAKISFKLQPLVDITPGPDLENSIGPDTDYTLIVVFGTISLLILLPACFNFANISIARALKRAKEIGLRKTMGGAKVQIFFQLITEAIAITLISLVGAVAIFMLIRPEFENMMPGAWLDLSLTWEMILMFLLFAVATGFLAGALPAFHFASLNPIQSIRGQSRTKGFSRNQVRRVLITFQFALSFFFIVLIIVFSRQYRYTLNFNYGFNTENILDVQLQGMDPSIFKSEFSVLPEVQEISMSSDILGLTYSSTQVHEQTSGDSLEVFQLFADPDYVENMGLQLIAGKNFPDGHDQQEKYIIVNEQFLSHWKMDNPVDAIGRTFLVDGRMLEIIGVLKDFHYASLFLPVESFFIRTDPSRYTYANMKIISNDIHATRTSMEKIWHKLNDTRKFEAHFFDDEMEELYNFYQAVLKLIGYLGLLAISITLLGLLGMVIYTTENRTREVGIRKVFGAGKTNLTYLLSIEFVKLMLWAILFAIPACFLLLDDLLSSVQYYSVRINAWDIFSGIVITFCLGIITIASQTWRAASKNPVDILRCE